ncbi:Peroxisomal membrane protein PEX14 [Auxenochlorella protothecoides]|uniref:Peroxisomal membrane protein PEX14 n=1 Tax=Auxenochlorella protothecoides TaxID=3075 RepID=A0A087SBD9_AUXPR|nr:Peroxisomal membrane protein PEX14 [Auxenochlorella protothecoides]KFM23043.1 Peroxisomal membrane protein PEX14 [Auxenochlorella protothecoides]
MSCQLEGEPVVTVRQLSNARVNVSAVESSEPQKEFMPHTARLRSMDFSAHAQEVREQMDWTASRWDLDSALKSEQEAAGKRAVWETGLLLAEDTLRARLRKLSLDLHIMEGDGNCQFRSVAHSVYGSQEQHMRVRRAAIMHMRRCPDEFRAFLGSDFDAYLASMSESGVWGDELTLRAISNALCITISVVIGATQMVRYIPTDYRQGKTVRSSAVEQKRQFLQRKGLTDAEIEEAFRRVPEAPAAAYVPAPSPHSVVAVPAGTVTPAGYVPVQQQQLVPAQPQPVRWGQAMLGAAFVAAGVYALKVVVWPYVADAVTKWKASQGEMAEAKALQEKESNALAEAIQAQTSELRNTVELLQKLTVSLEASVAESKRAAQDSLSLADLRAELRTLAGTIRDGPGAAHMPGAEAAANAAGVAAVKPTPHPASAAEEALATPFRPADESPTPAAPALSGPAHPASYMEVLEMLEKGQKPPGIRTDINDKAPNPTQSVPSPRLAPRRKPWERSVEGPSPASSADGETADTPPPRGPPSTSSSTGRPSSEQSPGRSRAAATSIYEAGGVIAGRLGSGSTASPSARSVEPKAPSYAAVVRDSPDTSDIRGWQPPPMPQPSISL